MNLTTFDPTQPVQTRAGKPATILCVDLKNELYPIGARLTTPGGDELLSVFTKDGRYSNDVVDSPNDLLNVGERIQVTCWLNVFNNNRVYSFQTKEAADAHAPYYPYPRVACIECPIDIPKPQC